MTEPAFVAETLAWCNEMRAGDGIEPLDRLPKGRRKNGLSCPCGKATGLEVLAYRAYSPGLSFVVCDLPEPVRDFVAAFDLGRLPQYDEAVT